MPENNESEVQKQLEKKKNMYNFWVSAGIISPWTAKHFLHTDRAHLIVEQQRQEKKKQRHKEVLRAAGISPEEAELIINKKAPANLAILISQYTKKKKAE